MSSLEERQLTAGGVRFHCVVAGEGPHTVLFLHPFPLDWTYWTQQLDALSSAGYRAAAMDLRGFGGSDRQPGDVSLGRLATDVAAVIRALGTGSATVVGSGMGGAVAWAVAHQRPAAVKSVVVMGAKHPMVASRPQIPRRLDHWLKHSSARKRHLLDASLVKGCLGNFPAPVHRAELLKKAGDYAEAFKRKTSVAAASATYEATRNPTLKDKRILKDRTDMPLWSIRGEMDPLVSRDAFAAEAQFANEVTHLEIPQAGHYVAMEAPAAINATILRHLDAVGVGAHQPE